MDVTRNYRSRFRAWQGQRQERTRLAAELASYRTNAERAELDAILARHSDADTAPLRQLLPS